MFPLPVPSLQALDIEPDDFLLDVREDEEWQAGHIRTALHIPLAEVPARLAELPGDGEIVVVCRSGNRSGRAVAWLNENGYDALNLEGGMQAWSAAHRPMVSETGEAPTVI